MTRRTAVLAIAAVLSCGTASRAAQQPLPALIAAVHSPARTPKFVARDTARHPVEELTFFGVTPTSTVVEIWPGGGYWTEILGPYLARAGHYTVALPASESEDSGVAKFRAKFVGKPGYEAMHVGTMSPLHMDVAPPGSADIVLTFRNLHNWMDEGFPDAAFAAFYAALKPGGVLGVEEHRGLETVKQDPKADNGYVRQDYAIALARKAGFELVGTSELDANPKDTKIWPKGVWTLPPSFEMGAVDHAKYAAIGEADNFILKFRKPRG